MLLGVYAKAKDLYTKAEEIDTEFRAFVQPINELRNAFDHVMRATLARFPECRTEDAERYISSSLDKAIGHVYRCFFDTADWMSIALRERAIKELGEFPNQCIMDVWPEYYKVHRSKLDGIARDIDIAKLRADKDISSDQLLEEVEMYSKILEGLITIVHECETRRPTMIEWVSRAKRETKANVRRDIIKALIIALAGFILGRLIS